MIDKTDRQTGREKRGGRKKEEERDRRERGRREEGRDRREEEGREDRHLENFYKYESALHINLQYDKLMNGNI